MFNLLVSSVHFFDWSNNFRELRPFLVKDIFHLSHTAQDTKTNTQTVAYTLSDTKHIPDLYFTYHFLCPGEDMAPWFC